MTTTDEGLRIVLTPAQLAAVFEAESIVPGGTIGNRLIGTLRVIGCGFEVAGGAALLAVPEPTMVTKAGGGALVLHGADQCVTGGRQIWTGRDARSLTERGASATARALGADRGTAETIGVVADIAVPVAAAAGAVRATAIRAGRISLARHEAQAGARLGGHTIARHVGQTEAQLRTRLASMSPRTAAVSSFDDLATAERVISRALRADRAAIEAWARTARPNATRALTYSAGRDVGGGVVRATGQYVRMTKVRVVLRLQTYNGMPHYILTSFPIP